MSSAGASRGKRSCRPGLISSGRCNTGPSLADPCDPNIQVKQLAISLLVTELQCRDTTQAVAALHDVPPIAVVFFDDALSGSRNHQRPARQDQPMAIELPTIGLFSSEVGLVDAFCLRGIAVVRQRDARQCVTGLDGVRHVVGRIVSVFVEHIPSDGAKESTRG